MNVVQLAFAQDQVWHPMGGGLMAPGGPGYAQCSTIFNGELIVGGWFDSADRVPVENIARWDGSRWNSVGLGLNNTVWTVGVYGGQLIAGGFFTGDGNDSFSRIARWNGTEWKAIGDGFNDAVYALASYNGELIAMGAFTSSGDVNAYNIARWDGSEWHPFPNHGYLEITAMNVVEGDLYVAGWAPALGGYRISRWTGSNWQLLSGVIDNWVWTLGSYNGHLVVGGSFNNIDNQPMHLIARWDGTAWHPLGTGCSGQGTPGISEVNCVAEYRGELVVGGYFLNAGQYLVNRIARWNGANWQAPISTGMANGGVWALTTFEEHLVAVGSFSVAGGVAVNGVARSQYSSLPACDTWEYLGPGFGGNNEPTIKALAEFGGEVIAAGDFTTAEGQNLSRIARWNGAVWQSLSGGMNSRIEALHNHDGKLVAGGYFAVAGGASANKIAAWNGTTWSGIGSGITGSDANVAALETYQGNLIAAGGFSHAGGVPAANIARWDGSDWHSLGAGTNGRISALVMYQGDLIAAGTFSTAGGQPAQHVARWDGNTWSAMNFPIASAALVSLAVANGTLYVASNSVWRWTGRQWEILPPIDGFFVGGRLFSYNEELIVGGGFAPPNPADLRYIARWDGKTWKSLAGLSLSSMVTALGSFDGQLIAAGVTTMQSGNAEGWGYVAKWNRPNVWFAPSSGSYHDVGNWELGLSAGAPTMFGKTPSIQAFGVAFTKPSICRSLCINNQRPIFNLNRHTCDIIDYTTIGSAQSAHLIVNNGTLFSPSVGIGSFGTLMGNGHIISGGITNVGTLRPSSSPSAPATLSLTGNYTQSFGTFNALIGPASYGRLDATGQANLAGTLQVDLISGAEPKLGNEYPILSCAGPLLGAFDVARLPYLGPDLVMFVQYKNGSNGSAPHGGAGKGDGGGGNGVVIVITSPNGNPDFDNSHTIVLDGEPTGLWSADVSESGAKDVALCVSPPNPNDPGTAAILINNGDGTFGDLLTEPVGLEPSGIIAAALADGLVRNDIIVSNKGDNNISVLFYEGNDLFTRLNLPVGIAPSSITTGDFNNDGLADLAVANSGSNNISILLNNGNRTFTTAPAINVGVNPSAITAAALTSSGRVDLIVANQDSHSVTILINQGGGVYAPVTIPSIPQPTGVGTGDLDNDRDLDVIVTSSTGLRLLTNTGNGSMTPPVSLPMGGEAVSFDQWDMDLDGDLDIVAVVVDEFSQASVIRVLRNDSTAQQLAFTLMPDLAENENARLVRGADVTGDALEDLIAVNITQQLAGGGSLLAIRPALLKGPTPCVADINNDHVVNVSDLLAVIAAWGPCPGACPPNCAADIVPNCAVNVSDLLAVISNWGACPK